MKLNYRDKVVLIVLAVLLVLVGGIMLFVKPAIDECNTASDTLESKKVELADLKEKNKKDANLNAEIKKLKTDTKLVTDNFYSYKISYKALEEVRQLFDKEDVEISPSSMQITSYGSTLLTPYLYTSGLVLTDIDESMEQYEQLAKQQKSGSKKTEKAEAAATANPENAENTQMQAIGCYDITCEFTSTLDGFKTFSQNLTTNTEKSMVLKSIVIDDVGGLKKEELKEDDDEDLVGNVHGTMTLQMIVLRKISE